MGWWPAGRGDDHLEVRALASYSRSGEGLHRYTDPEDGEVYLYTQFEPNDAHRAWPCVDQPDVKPEWTFHVIAPAGWVVSSNGVETAVEAVDDSGALRHDFTSTRPLSSYITAIVAGPWAVIEGGTWSGGASDGGHATFLCACCAAAPSSVTSIPTTCSR